MYISSDFSRLEINLNGCLENYRYFRSKLEASTKLLVLVKANAYGHGAVINPQDLEIAEGNGDTILHEVLHCLQMHNGVQMDRFMDEGYATYMTGRICDKDEEMNFKVVN